MKIGILSFWETQYNYGQVLQCYALQRFLRNLGYDAEHVRCRTGSETKWDKLKLIFHLAVRGYFFSWYKARKIGLRRNIDFNNRFTSEDKLDRGFDSFRENNMWFSDQEFDFAKMAKYSHRYDAMICGSDQVWTHASRQYCLAFGKKSMKRIAYAASMGGNPIQFPHQRYLWRKYLNDFDYISLRENDSAEEIRKIGFPQAKLVLDPTFLLCADDYRSLCRDVAKPNEDYVFLYLLGNKMEISVDEIYEWANCRNMRVEYVASQGRTDDYPKQFASIEQWLTLIDGAKYVITNSFHGMAFCIIFHKQFCVIPLAGSRTAMNNRIYSTLDRLQIEKRVFTGSFDCIEKTIDYSNADKVIAEERENRRKDFTALL